jgi:hypothetical protein
LPAEPLQGGSVSLMSAGRRILPAPSWSQSGEGEQFFDIPAMITQAGGHRRCAWFITARGLPSAACLGYLELQA